MRLVELKVINKFETVCELVKSRHAVRIKPSLLPDTRVERRHLLNTRICVIGIKGFQTLSRSKKIAPLPGDIT